MGGLTLEQRKEGGANIRTEEGGVNIRTEEEGGGGG